MEPIVILHSVPSMSDYYGHLENGVRVELGKTLCLKNAGIFFTSITEGGWRICFHPCLSVCPAVSRISQKVIDGFGRNLVLMSWFGDKNKLIEF